MYGSFDNEKAIQSQAKERLTPWLPLNSRVSSLQQQRDFLATVETLPSCGILQGAIYHLDTVHSVFTVRLEACPAVLRGYPDPILTHWFSDKSDLFCVSFRMCTLRTYVGHCQLSFEL